MSVITALAEIGAEEERKGRKKGRQYCEPELSMLSAASGKILPLDKSTAPRPDARERLGLRLGEVPFVGSLFHVSSSVCGVCLILTGNNVSRA